MGSSFDTSVFYMTGSTIGSISFSSINSSMSYTETSLSICSIELFL
jgi:hypothetical protein